MLTVDWPENKIPRALKKRKKNIIDYARKLIVPLGQYTFGYTFLRRFVN